MEKLPLITARSGSTNSPRGSNVGKAMVPGTHCAMPPVMNMEADVTIPRNVWSAWREAGKPRCLRRALTAEERGVLMRRKNELEMVIGGYHASEKDQLAAAVGKMYGAFPAFSMKGGSGTVARIGSVLQSLEAYPGWAVIKACEKVKTQGYVRSEGLGEYTRETHWPPSDAELIEVVRDCAKLYKDQYDSATDLLEAEVE